MSEATTAPAPEAPESAPQEATESVGGEGFLDAIDSALTAAPEVTEEVALHGDAENVGETQQTEANKVEDTQNTESSSDPIEAPEAPEGAVDEEDSSESSEIDPIDKLLDFEPPEDEAAGWTPKAAATFKKSKEALSKARSELSSVRSELSETKSRLTELEATIENPDVDALREKVKDYEHMALMSDVEKSSAFQTMVTEPLTELVAQSDEIAARNEIDPDALIEAITTEDVSARKEAISELLSSADDEDRYQIYSITEKIKPIFERRNAIYENIEAAAAEAEEIEAANTKREAAEALRNRQKAAKAVGERISERMPFLEEIEGLDMDSFIGEAGSTDPSSLDPVKATYNSIGAKLMPRLAAEVLRLQRENENLTGQLAEYEDTEPGAGGGGAASSPSKSRDSTADFLAAVSSQLG